MPTFCHEDIFITWLYVLPQASLAESSLRLSFRIFFYILRLVKLVCMAQHEATNAQHQLPLSCLSGWLAGWLLGWLPGRLASFHKFARFTSSR